VKRTITTEEALQMARKSMEASSMAQKTFAALVGISEQHLSDILHGKRGAGRVAAHFGYTIQTFTKPERAAKYLAERKAQ
jgi:plasmid maintenance system antidote protein VapI